MPPFESVASDLCVLARDAHSRGSVAATSGNFSAVVSREPLRIAITPSGADKGALAAGQILEIDGAGRVVQGTGRPSAETAVHLAVIRSRAAGAVAHTHSLWATLLSDGTGAGAREDRVPGLQTNPDAGARAARDPGARVRCHSREVVLEGYEMLKALSGVSTHEHREVVPIFENTQDWASGAREIERALTRIPGVHAFLIRRHGLYTWGQDVGEARRHLSALEFLLEAHGRRTWRS